LLEDELLPEDLLPPPREDRLLPPCDELPPDFEFDFAIDFFLGSSS
jgi:hypothetical protein